MTEQPTRQAARGAAASARDLVKVYGKGEAEVRALDGVTVDLMQGEFTAIMGPSGSGKSTLMHCLAALDTPTSGDAVVDGTSLGRLKDNGLKQIEMTFKVEKPGQEATLEFSSEGQPVPASPSQVRTLFARELKTQGIFQQFGVNGIGKEEDGRFQKMQLVMGEPVPADKFEAALSKTQAEFKERPQPDRLETFDSQLAAETQTTAAAADSDR